MASKFLVQLRDLGHSLVKNGITNLLEVLLSSDVGNGVVYGADGGIKVTPTTLGLGTAATHASGDFDAAGSAAAAQAAAQAYAGAAAGGVWNQYVNRTATAAPTTADNGKVMLVAGGVWTIASIPNAGTGVTTTSAGGLTTTSS